MKHKLVVGDSRNLYKIKEAVHLVVTSSPYPMISMWDELFSKLGANNFDEMHSLLSGVWSQCYRVLVDGGLMCVNIGDATRSTKGDMFRLYVNHCRVIDYCEKIGFVTLPYILWKKPTNRLNAFLGSGFLPPNAYVTVDCEYILIFRKGKLRKFPVKDKMRYESKFTKTERDVWFSQIWDDIKGVRQSHNNVSRRTAAYPEELVKRLIRMFSVKGDTVLDPFVGTGTTMSVACELERDSIGYEIEKELAKITVDKMNKSTSIYNAEFEVERV